MLRKNYIASRMREGHATEDFSAVYDFLTTISQNQN